MPAVIVWQTVSMQAPGLSSKSGPMVVMWPDGQAVVFRTCEPEEAFWAAASKERLREVRLAAKNYLESVNFELDAQTLDHGCIQFLDFERKLPTFYLNGSLIDLRAQCLGDAEVALERLVRSSIDVSDGWVYVLTDDERSRLVEYAEEYWENACIFE